jgi:Photosystem I reaction centre subunit VIII
MTASFFWTPVLVYIVGWVVPAATFAFMLLYIESDNID